MRARFVLTVLVLIVCTGTPAQQQQPIRVNPAPAITPTQPTAPTTQPAPSQQKVIVAPVAPAAQPLNPNEIRAVALQSGPPANATREEQASLQRISERLRHKDRAQAQTDWAFLVERAAQRDDKHKSWIELESWSNYVLHRAYVAPDAELNRAADKVRFYNEQKEAAHARRAELEQAKREFDRTAVTRNTVTVRRLTLSDSFTPNQRAVTYGDAEPMTAESVVPELQGVVILCNQADEKEQMANVELQDKLQKQQQILQTMSNMSKMFHDTAMSIIQNMKG